MDQTKIAQTATIAAVAFILIAFLSNSTFLTIKPGEKGVLFKKFSGGIDTEVVYSQGFHVVAPWNEMILYDVREQIKEETMDVLSSGGLTISVDVSTRFHPQADKIGYLHNEIGREYGNRIVRDVVRSAAREIIGKYTPEELYSEKRDSVRVGIETKVREKLSEKYITLEAVNLRSIKLPEAIERAIENKLVQEQEKQQYEFKIAKESKEAERKKIEAEGIRTFQKIVSEGISQEYLRWKGIEATERLAGSENAKVVVIGSGKDGLPIILGQ
ncbi:MAG: prohibitin family protein [Chitinophagales bacterium]